MRAAHLWSQRDATWDALSRLEGNDGILGGGASSHNDTDNFGLVDDGIDDVVAKGATG